jgi:hypothetical protein
MDNIRGASKTVWAMLDGSQVLEASGATITLAVAPSLARRLSAEGNATTIVTAMKGVLTGEWHLVIVPNDASAGGPSGSADPAGAAPSGPKPAPEPDPRDDTDETAPAADPEADALKLLQDQLGARPVD